MNSLLLYNYNYIINYIDKSILRVLLFLLNNDYNKFKNFMNNLMTQNLL